jgi:hypothetical protein
MMPTIQFRTASLFGGAITVNIPETWADVRQVFITNCFTSESNHPPTYHVRTTWLTIVSSEIREVPSNQEVFLDRDGFSSIVVDILERVDKRSNEEALDYHFSDIVDEDLGVAQVWERRDASLRLMP